jgi:hypothetical protein
MTNTWSFTFSYLTWGGGGGILCYHSRLLQMEEDCHLEANQDTLEDASKEKWKRICKQSLILFMIISIRRIGQIFRSVPRQNNHCCVPC